ncbi:MAG: hypothetical protein J6J60_00270 [Clostridia bacterium]|nr:hypothetical protein [Clostridia bacterium]
MNQTQIFNKASALESIIQCGEEVARFLPQNDMVDSKEFNRLVLIARKERQLIKQIDAALSIRSKASRNNALKMLKNTNPLAEELIELRKAL